MSWFGSLLHPSVWLNSFRPALRPLERRIKEAVSSRLASEARLLFEEQLAHVNFVQRRGREVGLYCLRGGRAVHEVALFPNRVPDLRLATVLFRITGVLEMLQAECYLTYGYVSSIVFSREIKVLKNIQGISVESVVIHQDPMSPTEMRPTGEEPLSQAARERLLANIAARLPDDYLEMTRASDGPRIHDWEVLGLPEVYRVTLEEADYYLLARNETLQKAIGVKARVEAPELYLLDYGGLTPVRLGASLRKAIEALLAESTAE